MANENDIKIIVKAEVKKAVSDLKKFGKGAKASTDKASGGFKKFAKSLVSIKGLLAGTVAVGLFALGKSAVQAAIGFEQTQVSFTTFLKSAKKADVLLKKLEDFSIVTPFTIDQINKAGKSMLGMGIAAEDLLPNMKKIGDIAAGTGKDFNELSLIFAKSAAAGTIFAEDINQLSEAGIPIIGQFAKQFGVTEAAIKKMASEGKIKFSDLDQAFTELTAEGGLFFNLMADQSKTLGGRISTLQGNFSLLARSIGQKLAPAVGRVVEFFNDLLVTQAGLETSTDALITLNNELTIVNGKLEDSLDDLNKKESENLKLRKAQLKLDIAKNIENINDRFTKLNETIQVGKGSTKEFLNQFERLDKQLIKEEKQFKRVSSRIDELEGLQKKGITTVKITQDTIRRGIIISGKSISIDTELVRLRKEFLQLDVKRTKTGRDLISINLEQANAVTKLAIAAEDDLDLIKGLKPPLQALVLARIKSLTATDRETESLKKNKKERESGTGAINAEIKALKKAIETGLALNKLSEEQKLQDTAEFIEKRVALVKKAGFTEAEARLAVSNLIAEKEKIIEEKRRQVIKDTTSFILNTFGQTAQAINSLTNAIFQSQLNDLTAQREQALSANAAFREQVNQIEKQESLSRTLLLQQEIDRARIAGDEEVTFKKEQELAKVESLAAAKAKEEEINASFDAKEKALKTKQAKRDRRLGIFRAILAIPMGAAQAIAQFGPPPSPLGIAALIANDILGHINLAAAIAVPLPRLRGGLDFVPRDKFPALLDEGERVLTKEENTNFNNSFAGNIIIQGVSNPSEFATQLNDYLKSRGAINTL